MQGESTVDRESLRQVVASQNGILFAKQRSIVGRSSYSYAATELNFFVLPGTHPDSGRSVIAENSSFDDSAMVDERGYLPVEWWIMSVTEAGNPVRKAGEGLTVMRVGSQDVRLKDLAAQHPDALGDFTHWPLTKVLDIGGAPRRPLYSSHDTHAHTHAHTHVHTNEAQFSPADPEVPPIPCHIHAGDVLEDGTMNFRTGKLEAYFFPPVDVPPYNKNFGEIHTRLGLRPDVTKEEVRACLARFGVHDDMYRLLNVYPVAANEGWYIKPGVIHSPGPWVTFEIQKPQDDFHFCAWQFGVHFHNDKELGEHRDTYLLRGLRDEAAFVEQALDWQANVRPDFQQQYKTPRKVIEQGEWGCRFQIFFFKFYGEGFEISAGSSYTRPADARPFGGIAWSGQGTINGQKFGANENGANEFLVVSGHALKLENSHASERLIVYTVFPYDESIED